MSATREDGDAEHDVEVLDAVLAAVEQVTGLGQGTAAQPLFAASPITVSRWRTGERTMERQTRRLLDVYAWLATHRPRVWRALLTELTRGENADGG